MKTTNRCWKCKSKALKAILVAESRTVASHVFTAELPWLHCDGCGERTISGPVLEALDLSIASALARAGITAPEALRFMRKALGLPAAELAELLQLRPETVSRMENGKTVADRRTVALLAAMVFDRQAGREDTLERLRVLAHPPRLAKRVQIRTA